MTAKPTSSKVLFKAYLQHKALTTELQLSYFSVAISCISVSMSCHGGRVFKLLTVILMIWCLNARYGMVGQKSFSLAVLCIRQWSGAS